MDVLEYHAERIWMARRRSALDVCLESITTLLDLEQCGSFKTHVPGTGRRYLLAHVACKPKRDGTKCAS